MADKEKATAAETEQENLNEPEVKEEKAPEAESKKPEKKSDKKSAKKAAKEEAKKAEAKPEEKSEPKAEEKPALDAAAAESDRYLRLQAEFVNYKRRTQKEKENIYADVKTDVVAAFLPVYDNLERALTQSTEDENYRKGVEMTMNQLKEVFEKLGVTEIDCLGKAFDPTCMNAVMHIEDETKGQNEVADVFQKGFMLGDKVIRFAMVRVAN